MEITACSDTGSEAADKGIGDREVASREVTNRIECFKAGCRSAGVKLTHQRLEIFREIAASQEHPDAEAIMRAVQPRMPTVSMDTVYRTLWLLNDLGLISTLVPRQTSIRFDANLAVHHHFTCIRCGMIRDFESPELDTLALPEGVRHMGSIVSTRIEVRGICDSCHASQSLTGSA